MKKQIKLFIALLLIAAITNAQNGKYAGSMKKLVGLQFVSAKNLSQLKGWTFHEGSMVGTPEDEMLCDVYSKGTTYIIFFAVKEDADDTAYTIEDVLEVKGVVKGMDIKTITCKSGTETDEEIVALVKQKNAEIIPNSNIKKAWRFNRSKNRFEVSSTKYITCINEGMEQY